MEELHYALQSLPSCQRCRRLRKRCDSQMPACRLCQSAKVDCTIFDHALQQTLSRKYIQSLVLRLESLKEKHATLTLEVDAGRQALPEGTPNETKTPSSLPHSAFDSDRGGDFNNHFPVPSVNGSTSRFYGSSSVFALAVEVLALASDKNLFNPSGPSEPVLSAKDGHDRDLDSVAPTAVFDTGREFAQSLIADYMASINIIHPCIDETHLQRDLDRFLATNGALEFDADKLQRIEKYQCFRIALMCSIACTAKARHSPSLAAYGNQFYAQAVRYVEEVTAEVSPQSLEALLLLVIYCLFNPRKGNIWKILDFACRLSIQLGYHTEQGHSILESEDDKTWRRTAFWSLYSMERLVGQCFGRPSDLPSSIITTEYPTVVTDTALLDDESIQKVSAAQGFHLMFLRSEIYTEIYLSATSPLPRLKWFFDQHDALRQWYQNPSQRPFVNDSTNVAGVGEVTREIMYHSSVLFLFQRHLLEALSTIRRHNPRQRDVSQPNHPHIIPSEPYHSSKALLRLYTLIIRSTTCNSPLSIFPVTFLAAYSIFQAGMTLISYALLSLEPAIRIHGSSSVTPSCLQAFERRGSEETGLDFSDLLSLSNDCLVLLAWCKEQWPGMEGMLDAFARCSAETIPKVLRV
ncbi:uncharacterized protein Z520_03288 [Fonsecaea multimorphosa CBS 102226]|uniref:Zn(2)-C6 fungal-type domain-containing protein n=1 Tax=Fonsecaea multimorphosa CBS 102226 TaxID=1442371 RepID=A0A0D2KBZ5_9EURO|nr:uncharacterized protein Z520_03288 [Fonsecaea multimorphosa CBS 102226]KIY00625.1 hypothetical protein Z520_03288 [Fonsecaea multimorphosa CBS 102226]OAL19015.1 hypothetical protein AYO22_10344 [Fonsecaea multimorphosa]